MPIYRDKNAKGEETGRWRVELQKAGRRYRERHDTMKDAKADEARVLKAWAEGQEVGKTKVREDALRTPTLAFGYKEAQGSLWRTSADPRTAWLHVSIINDILGPETLLDEVDTQSIDRVIKELRAGALGRKPVTDSTINRYLSHYNTWLKWLSARKHRKVPMSEVTIDWQEEDEGRIRWITLDEEADLKRLLPAKCWKIVKVAIETGCRRAELLGAEPGQLNGTKLHLWKTKTKTPRTIPMEPYVARMLKDLLTDGMPSESELRYQWDKAKAAMGLSNDDDFVFHACRHTCATRLVEAQVNLKVIQNFLGHKVIQTTMRYAHVHDGMLLDAVAIRKQHVDNIQERSRFSARTVGNVGLQAA